eukprot:SAG31_NODE_19629_length_596_cov_0.991952_2_plen_43_part_01
MRPFLVQTEVSSAAEQIADDSAALQAMQRQLRSEGVAVQQLQR